METTTVTEGYEVWTKNGRSFYLVPDNSERRAAREAAYLASLTPEALAAHEADLEEYGYDEGWYPDFPGEREPLLYELVDVATGEVADDTFVSRPYWPDNWYDAVVPSVMARGYEPPPPTEEELAVCEHGLSARLCAGPMHYPDDRYD